MSPVDTMSADSRLFTPSRVLVLLFCAGLFATAQFHRAAGGVLASGIGIELNLGAATLGLALGSMFIASMLLQIPAGILFDRYGARLIAPILLLITGVGALWFAGAANAIDLTGARFLLGAGSGVTSGAAFVLFARWFPTDRFATMTGLMVAIGGVGGLAGTYPLALLDEYFGWRTIYLWVAGGSLVLALVGAVAIRDRPPNYGENDAPRSLTATLRGYREIFATPSVYPIFVMGIVTFAPITTVVGLWGGPYLSDVHGLAGPQAGLILFAMFAVTIVGALIFGPLDRLFRSRKRVVIGGAMLSTASLAALAAFPDLPLFSAIGCLLLMVLGQHYYITLAAHNRALFPARLVGRASTLLLVFQVGGISAMQAGFGTVLSISADGDTLGADDYGAGFGFMAVCVLCAAAIYGLAKDVSLSEPPPPIRNPGTGP